MYLALRELQHHKLRSLLLGTVVTLIAFMVFMLGGLTRGLAHDNAALLQSTPATHFITTHDAEGIFTRSFLTPDDVKLAQAATAGQATPLAQTFISMGSGDKQLSGVLLGVAPSSFMTPTVTEGQALQAGTAGAVVDESLRRKEGVQLGDTLTLKPGGETLRVTGFTRNARLNHQPVVYVTLDHWQTLNPRSQGTVNAVAVQGDLRAPLPGGLSAQTRAETLQVLPGYKEEQGSLNMIQVFLIVVAAFVMAVFFYVITLQKTPQFGLLKAIGASTRTLAGSLLAQMLLLTTAAVAVAAALTLALVQVLPQGLPFTLTLPVLLGAAALLILVAALSSLLSLRTVARVDPLIAIGTAA